MREIWQQIHELAERCLKALKEERYNDLFLNMHERTCLLESLKESDIEVHQTELQKMVDDTVGLKSRIWEQIQVVEARLTDEQSTADARKAYASFMYSNGIQSDHRNETGV